MILATDVHYYNDKAQASGVLFEHWEDDTPLKTISVSINKVAAYKSGSFYKRELPCLLELINAIDEKIDCVIVDGFVFLGKKQKSGLGKYLYDALDEKIPVIGVAKNGFHGTPDNTRLLRGNSNKPLFVTAIGLDLETAKNNIKNMAGDYRFPTLLKLVDTVCRDLSNIK